MTDSCFVNRDSVARITIHGKVFPKPGDSSWRNSRAGAYHSWKEGFAWQVKAVWRRPPITYPSRLGFDIYGVTWKGDVDNMGKALVDALAGVVLQQNKSGKPQDSVRFVREIRTTFHLDRKNPRVEITIEKVKGE